VCLYGGCGDVEGLYVYRETICMDSVCLEGV